MSSDAVTAGRSAADHRAPTRAQVVYAIARREIGIARKRRLVKLLFLGSLLPPIVMAVLLVVRVMIEGAGFDFGWDPLAQFIQIQIGPVLFLALAIGTPSVARDRGEDVLFLYATRPVTPWSYTFGKMAAVVVPAIGLLLLPGILIAILRVGIMEEIGAGEAFALLGKLVVISVLMAWAYAGICVGASAAAKKARWALLVAFAAMAIPDMISEMLRLDVALDAPGAVKEVVDSLFARRPHWPGFGTIVVLLGWGALGAYVTASTVRREMTP